ncbi:alanine dehydrogenase [Helicobacter saguini]|uniref:Alanine dehydrogenase 1 n=1 Tax=Helicobacter saguini TaxID=1548018 RepID=A0A347VNS4_9HELI|nr:alanine dehydrogenase [Helicobacter saguini]MWV61658.1 alanine dehydrogenase [Helicobacter saguini]MWV67670.1 alanine dehydrogenase [Helicobacter saguini]MWV70022.1 alanine dehydrogenase [Helicobacter saguini]MWV72765.1 alanine dehydrogenase [Helicobacter saguini]TLD92724.1 alanine dehydrogenase [Helicobacter saguini]
MKIGIVKEIMNHEHRVGLIPSDVRALKDSNKKNEIMVESGLGATIGYSDKDYEKAGATIIKEAKKVWQNAEMIVKCKEPLECEFKYLHKDLILYSFLDLAYSKELATALVDSKVTSICGETIAGARGDYPILSAMSEITGKFASQHAATLLSINYGGRGILLGGCVGIAPARAVVVGGGVVGMNAARVLAGMGADVSVLDINVAKLATHPLVIDNRVKVLYCDEISLNTALSGADILIGAVLVTANATPKVVKSRHLKAMNKGGVVLDVSVDLGGCVEGARQTTHDKPTYELNGLTFYGVPNIPGVVARTSSISYSRESLPYVIEIAKNGFKSMLKLPGAIGGLNAFNGYITLESIAKAFKLPYKNSFEIMES